MRTFSRIHSIGCRSILPLPLAACPHLTHSSSRGYVPQVRIPQPHVRRPVPVLERHSPHHALLDQLHQPPAVPRPVVLHLHYRMVRRRVEAHRRMLAVEADVVTHLTVVEAHPTVGRFGRGDPLDKPAPVPHTVGEADFNHSPLAGRLQPSPSRLPFAPFSCFGCWNPKAARILTKIRAAFGFRPEQLVGRMGGSDDEGAIELQEIPAASVHDQETLRPYEHRVGSDEEIPSSRRVYGASEKELGEPVVVLHNVEKAYGLQVRN